MGSRSTSAGPGRRVVAWFAALWLLAFVGPRLAAGQHQHASTNAPHATCMACVVDQAPGETPAPAARLAPPLELATLDVRRSPVVAALEQRWSLPYAAGPPSR